MIIRLSQKLADKIHQTGLQQPPPEPDILADWYGHVFVFNRCQYIIVINSVTVLTTVFSGRGVTSIDKFMRQFRAALADTCRDIAATNIYKRIITSAESSTGITKSVNQRVTGCMNEQIFMAAAILEQGSINCFNLAKRLNENLQSKIHFMRPREAFLGLAGMKVRAKNIAPSPRRERGAPSASL